jgi:hypothetical protein
MALGEAKAFAWIEVVVALLAVGQVGSPTADESTNPQSP